MREFIDTDTAKRRAQAYVYGAQRHSKTGQFEPRFGGHFADRFLDHPWVRESMRDGWDINLRGHLVYRVTQRLLAGKTPMEDVEDLMPDRATVDHWRKQAKRYRDGAEWRRQAAEQYGSVDAYLGRGKPRRFGEKVVRSLGAILGGKS